MYYIYKDDIANYRYAVAKDVFLRVYSDFVFAEDIPKSNCMKCLHNNKQCIVSLFKAPSTKITKKTDVYIFYNAKSYKNAYEKNSEKRIHINKFNKEFNEKYDKNFEEAIKMPEKYIESKVAKNIVLFEGILLTHDDVEGIDEYCYKYYSDDKVQNNRYSVVDGNISFADPNTFNDPFDVNCFFSNDVDMSNLFRIFCVAPDPREILMWSYYGADHKGYCFEYKKQDILEKILDYHIDGICIIGNVDYKAKRPKQKSKLNAVSFTEISFYIQAAFTKYEEWKHEKEFRFVMLSDSFSSASSQYQNFTIPVYTIYNGIKGTGMPVVKGDGNQISTVKVLKDPNEYKLI